MNVNRLICFAFVITAFVACKKDNNSTTDLRIHLTDAPFDAEQVNVDIQQIRVNFHGDSTGWIDIETNAGIYNLLDYQNGIDTLLAQSTVPAGMLKEVRFVLGNENSIMIDSVVYPLTVPSGSESGLKIKVNKQLNAQLDSLVIDFDAGLSVVQAGKDNYLLKPVLKLK